MAWDRLKLMVAVVVFALLALVVLLNRLSARRLPSDRTRDRLVWTRPRKKAALALIVLGFGGAVVVANRLSRDDDAEKFDLEACRNGTGSCRVPPDYVDPPGVGVRTICVDEVGKEIACPGG
jgi:hypothetical protein